MNWGVPEKADKNGHKSPLDGLVELAECNINIIAGHLSPPWRCRSRERHNARSPFLFCSCISGKPCLPLQPFSIIIINFKLFFIAKPFGFLFGQVRNVAHVLHACSPESCPPTQNCNLLYVFGSVKMTPPYIIPHFGHQQRPQIKSFQF